jgi:hypothetical protein
MHARPIARTPIVLFRAGALGTEAADAGTLALTFEAALLAPDGLTLLPGSRCSRTTSPPNGWSSSRTIANHDDEFWRDELIDSASVIGVAALGAILATAS